MESCDLRITHIKEVVQQYGAALILRQAVQGVGKFFSGDLLSRYAKGLSEAFIDSEGKHIFETVPMNFKGPDGKIPDFWIELFSRLSQEVPQGKPGTNPNDLSKSQWLTTVYKFF